MVRLPIFVVLAMWFVGSSRSAELRCGISLSDASPVLKEQIPTTLEMLSNMVRSNYESLSTIKGEARKVVSVRTHNADFRAYLEERMELGIDVGDALKMLGNGDVNDIQASTIHFELDRDSGHYYSQYEQRPEDSKYVDLKSGKQFPLSFDALQTQSIVNEDGFFHFDPTSSRGRSPFGAELDAGSRAVFREERDAVTQRNDVDVFDARKMLQHEKFFWELLSELVGFEDPNAPKEVNPTLRAWRVGRTGKNAKYLVVAAATPPGSERIEMSYLMDQRIAGNLTCVETRFDGVRAYSTSWKYKALKASTFFPIRRTFNKYNTSGDTVQTIDIDMLSVELTKPPYNAFDIERFPVEDGDRLIDTVDETTKFRRGGKWVDEATAIALTDEPIPNSDGGSWSIWFNVLIVALLGAVILFWRYKEE